MRACMFAMAACTVMFAADSIHEFNVDTIDGKSVSLGAYKGKAVLIVNTASQ